MNWQQNLHEPIPQCADSLQYLVEAKNHGMIESVKPHPEGVIRGGYLLGPILVASAP